MMPTYKLALMVAMLLGGHVSGLPADDWPMLGRDGTRNAVSPEKNPPTFWQIGEVAITSDKKGRVLKPSKNVKWKADLGPEVYASPVISDGLVWIGANRHGLKGEADAALLRCYRERDGKLLYEYVSPRLESRFEDPPWWGLSSSPSIDGDQVWFFTNRNTLFAIADENPPVKTIPQAAPGLDKAPPAGRPRVLCLQAGDTLEVVQRDPVGSGGYGGVNLGFLINPPHNFTIRPNAPRVIKIEKAEPTSIQVTCMSHNWMHAYLIVLDHPFVSVSDDQGAIEIKDLPAGNELVFRLFHESAPPIPEVEIDGQNVTLDRNLIRLMIKPGMNDFGTIVIPAAAFRRD